MAIGEDARNHDGVVDWPSHGSWISRSSTQGPHAGLRDGFARQPRVGTRAPLPRL